MPPRRRTFYLADATLLSNPKVRRLSRTHPDEWLAVIGAFHVLIGVATLNGSPKLSSEEITDVLGGHEDLVTLLRGAGLMTARGIDKATFDEWTPKARPKYPSDDKPRPDSGGVHPDSGGVGHDSDGIPGDSDGIPTSVTSSSSGSTTASSPPSRGVGRSATKNDDGPKARTKEKALLALSDDFLSGKIDELTYTRQRKALTA
jgi:hypothetical protein